MYQKSYEDVKYCLNLENIYVKILSKDWLYFRSFILAAVLERVTINFGLTFGEGILKKDLLKEDYLEELLLKK